MFADVCYQSRQRALRCLERSRQSRDAENREIREIWFWIFSFFLKTGPVHTPYTPARGVGRLARSRLPAFNGTLFLALGPYIRGSLASGAPRLWVLDLGG